MQTRLFHNYNPRYHELKTIENKQSSWNKGGLKILHCHKCFVLETVIPECSALHTCQVPMTGGQPTGRMQPVTNPYAARQEIYG